ncbi:hypothetical protein [Mesorhizobium sp.]|uniref:hypothetical protein n=1 Tax=Mesorhizobium sp. TaxID=1871066 RepID=UPI00257C5ABB|nr:hypothetical protein [Mesorhizobium sp.]
MTETETISPVLRKLLEIMTSPEVPDARSVEAAKAIIEFEAPPEVFDLTYQFLMGLANDDRQEVSLKLEALKLIRKVEARRVVPGVTKGSDPQAQGELGRRMAASRRRLELWREGKWPPASLAWAGGLEPVECGPIEVDGLGKRLEDARLRAEAKRKAMN